MMNFFISCPKGLELLLAKEVEDMGADGVRPRVAGIECRGDLALGYRICLWSRLANRVLLPLARSAVVSADDLYQSAVAVAWHDHFAVDASFAVDFRGTAPGINNTQFGAQRVKDAIVDVFRIHTGARPNVDTGQPDIRINARLARGELTLGIDLSGESLHRRGYRRDSVAAPLKENLAAALLLRADWPALAAAGGALVDPLCGGGTLLIEAAMMAADIAPGLQRQRFGFMAWTGHQPDLWDSLVNAAEVRRAIGLRRPLPPLLGSDENEQAIEAAAANCQRAGLDQYIHLARCSLAEWRAPSSDRGALPVGANTTGLVITNPPYGARLGDVEELRGLYRQLGDTLKREFPGWRAAIFTGYEELSFELGLRSHRRYQLFNGTIAAQLLLFDIRSDADRGESERERQRPNLSGGAEMLANRLRKNQRKLTPWLKREAIDCFRLYDADLPEYAAAIDRYGDAVLIQEYAPPAAIEESTARHRLAEVRAAVAAVLAPPPDHLFCKQRRRQRGESQYQRLDGYGTGRFEVTEGAARFEVNLAEYIDTGLFLDHRPVRKLIAGLAKGKRFLNLYCYTATATVQAVLGGAMTSLSVDMSNAYLAWATRNFRLNDVKPDRHRLLRADCVQWLASGADNGLYDLILLDPPTFSNSKKMASVLDIQRDHPQLIELAMCLLAEGGTLIFSTNFRRFKLDPSIAQRYQATDISARTLDPDFARDARVHRCWLVKESAAAQR